LRTASYQGQPINARIKSNALVAQAPPSPPRHFNADAFAFTPSYGVSLGRECFATSEHLQFYRAPFNPGQSFPPAFFPVGHLSIPVRVY
jgi:hypothetical protein